MRFFYNTNHIADGDAIIPLSIGIVAEDGPTYYAVNQDITRGRLHRCLRRDEFFVANVAPHLPQPSGDWNNHMPRSWLFDYNSPFVKPRHTIGNEVRDFLFDGPHDVELWATAAHDHIVLRHLLRGADYLPNGIPDWTNNLRQEHARLGSPDLPAHTNGDYSTLAGARHTAVIAREILENT